MENLEEESMASIHISEVTLSNEITISLPSNGVTAIVGGNNSGKSTLLRQMSNWISNMPFADPPMNEHKILHNLQLAKVGTQEKFIHWIQENSTYNERTPTNPIPQEGYVRPRTSVVDAESFKQAWSTIDNGGSHLGPAGEFIKHYLPAGSGYGFNTGRRQNPAQPPSDPLHYLEHSKDLRDAKDKISYEVFNVHITVDKLGQQVCLRVGKPPEDIPPPGYDDDERPYREALDRLSLLDHQGDGMKAFIGKLLPIMTSAYHIIMIDEPEAFLHPPQATRLGRYLGTLAKEVGVQVIIATHDRNIIIGLLESRTPLSVVRLNREGDTTTASQLDPDQIESIWSEPSLRYSHVLDGLFHTRVVLVENQRDCTFYAAALDAAHEKSPLPIAPSDILFVPTNGKDGLAPVVKALKAIKIPTVASPDIDILNDSAKIKKLVEYLGHSWEEFEEEYTLITGQFRTPRTPLLAAQVATSIEDVFKRILEEDPKRKWDSKLAEEIRAATRSDQSPWKELKKHGVSTFDKSVDLRAIQFFDKMDKIGLVIVRVGELECFAQGLGVNERKGNEWLRAALKAGAHESDEASKHVRRLCTVSPAIG
ncbi:ATP-dependent nuclease [Lentzea chajnantorensis]